LPDLLLDDGKPWAENLILFASGVVLGILLLGLIRGVIEPNLGPLATARIARAGALPVWRRLLIIYVAATTEELVFRVLLFSVFAGLLARLIQGSNRTPNAACLWVSNGVSALAFGLAHLPSWAQAAPLSGGLVLMVLGLNGFAGLCLGWIFVKRGIFAAMIFHAGADCALQLIGPLTGRSG
jgi:hypothetical protein